MLKFMIFHNTMRSIEKKFFIFFVLAIISFLIDGVKVVSNFPHDEKCFSQGLTIHKNRLYECCGLYGKSSVRIVDIETGAVLKSQKMGKQYFGEGCTIVNNMLFVLTWKNKQMLVYDDEKLKLLKIINFQSFNGQGWGLTTDNKQLILSDGSDRITFYEIPNIRSHTGLLKKIREIVVTDPRSSRSMPLINEMEYVNGFIYANVWYKDIILKINPLNGHIVRKFDLSHVYPRGLRKRGADCLNGIAFNDSDKNFIVTGKLWDKYYKLDIPTENSSLSEDL